MLNAEPCRERHKWQNLAIYRQTAETVAVSVSEWMCVYLWCRGEREEAKGGGSGDAVMWDSPFRRNGSEWQNLAPRRPATLRIYEAHIGVGQLRA